MKYLADVLTLFRLLAAFAIAYCIFTDHWQLALVLFLLAGLSDALDGACARHWPYTAADEARLPWRKIDHHAIDNIPDGSLVALAAMSLAIRFDYWIWLLVLIYSVSLIFMGAVQLLARRGMVRCAEVIDVVFGWWFSINIAMIVVELAYRSGNMTTVLLLSAFAVPILAYFKRDRALTRPETRELAERYRDRRGA